MLDLKVAWENLRDLWSSPYPKLSKSHPSTLNYCDTKLQAYWTAPVDQDSQQTGSLTVQHTENSMAAKENGTSVSKMDSTNRKLCIAYVINNLRGITLDPKEATEIYNVIVASTWPNAELKWPPKTPEPKPVMLAKLETERRIKE